MVHLLHRLYGVDAPACISTKAPGEEIYGKSTQGTYIMLKSTFSGLQRCRWTLIIWVYVYLFSCCCLPNMRYPAKFSKIRSYRSSSSSKVIDLGANLQAHVQLLINH